MHDYRGTAFASELLISVNKVNIFSGGQKIRRNLPVDFVFFTKRQINWEISSYICGLFRIYELYKLVVLNLNPVCNSRKNLLFLLL